jgi:hypothetical protein
MRTLTTLRDQLAKLVKSITVANGYSTDLVSKNVFKVYAPARLQDKSDGSYPKAFIVTDNGTRTRLAASQKDRVTNFLVVFVGKVVAKGADNDPLATEALAFNFVDDLEKACDANDTLYGFVFNVEMTNFTTDSGFTYPEAVAVCHVQVFEKGVPVPQSDDIQDTQGDPIQSV